MLHNNWFLFTTRFMVPDWPNHSYLSSEIKLILMPTPIDFSNVACCIHDYDDIRLLLSDKGLEAAGEMTEVQRYESAAAECEVWDERIAERISNEQYFLPVIGLIQILDAHQRHVTMSIKGIRIQIVIILPFDLARIKKQIKAACRIDIQRWHLHMELHREVWRDDVKIIRLRLGQRHLLALTAEEESRSCLHLIPDRIVGRPLYRYARCLQALSQ